MGSRLHISKICGRKPHHRYAFPRRSVGTSSKHRFFAFLLWWAVPTLLPFPALLPPRHCGLDAQFFCLRNVPSAHEVAPVSFASSLSHITLTPQPCCSNLRVYILGFVPLLFVIFQIGVVYCYGIMIVFVSLNAKNHSSRLKRNKEG